MPHQRTHSPSLVNPNLPSPLSQSVSTTLTTQLHKTGKRKRSTATIQMAPHEKPCQDFGRPIYFNIIAGHSKSPQFIQRKKIRCWSLPKVLPSSVEAINRATQTRHHRNSKDTFSTNYVLHANNSTEAGAVFIHHYILRKDPGAAAHINTSDYTLDTSHPSPNPVD